MNNSKVWIVGVILICVALCFAQTLTSRTAACSNCILWTVSDPRERSFVEAKSDRSDQKFLCGRIGGGTNAQDNDKHGKKVPVQDSDNKNSQITIKDLIIALIGFGAAIIGGLIQSFFSMWQSAKTARENVRNAYRERVSDLADKIGEIMHELLSGCDIYLKKWERHGATPYKQEDQEVAFQESIRKQLCQADDAANKLRELRLRARYKLYGMDEALRALTRVNNWITHFKRNVSAGRAFLDKADKLREVVDEALMAVIDSGERPTREMRQKVNDATMALRLQYQKTAPKFEEKEWE